jgi:hypothetical protein
MVSLRKGRAGIDHASFLDERKHDDAGDNAAVPVKVLPQGKLEILGGASHLPEVEPPDIVNKMLGRTFFS